MGDVISSGMASDEIISGPRPDSHVIIWGKNVLHRGNSKCKGPEVGMSLVCEAHREDNIVRAE